MLTANKVNNEKSLLEAYGKRIAFSEDLYSRTHSGEKMSNFKKVTLAKLLENTNKFLNEAFGANSVGTQQQDMGAYKKFCLNLVTVAVPNLIAPELVIVYPMPSITGYITYVNYTAGTNKGETHQGDLFNNPFKLGNVDTNYTSNIVVEPFTGANSDVTASWFPVYNGDIEKYQAKITSITTSGGVNVPVADDASVTVGTDGKTLTLSNGTGTAITATDTVKVKYVYDNIDIPQNDVPLLNANMAGIPLFAHARRIAVEKVCGLIYKLIKK